MRSAGPCPRSSMDPWRPCSESPPRGPGRRASSSRGAAPCQLASPSACSLATSSWASSFAATACWLCPRCECKWSPSTWASTRRRRLAGSPSPTQAGLYSHTCAPGTLVAEWREIEHAPPFSVLVAVSADGRLHENAPLCWNFDLHCVQGCYALDDADGQDWCADGGAVRECDCNAPYPRPRDRVLRAPLPEEDAGSSEEDSWSPALGLAAHWTSANPCCRS